MVSSRTSRLWDSGVNAMMQGTLTWRNAMRAVGTEMVGWFAGIGGIVGAAVGANRKDGRFSELVTDAIQAGNTVLVVRTHAEPDRELVRVVLEASFRGREGVTTESA